MNRTISLPHRSPEWIPYGRNDLRRVFPRNTLVGLLISTVLHGGILGAYYLGQYFGAGEEIPTVRVRVVSLRDLGPPPSLQQSQAPPAIAVASRARPSVGVPVPVPDAEVSPEHTIASQAEMSAEVSPAMEGLESGEAITITDDILIDDEPGMNEFIPVERSPEIIRRVIPEYPDMAIRAGLEGVVWVKVLLDKEGKPVKAVVIKSSAELFDQPAIDAAMRFLFTPAIMNQGPVKVWVSIPFRFQLREGHIPG